MNFNDFARQMILKYKVAVAIAILKSKPKNIPVDHHINLLKAKISDKEMDYDSDVTICSDDFLMVDDDIVESKTIENVEEANLSANLLEGFDLEEFIEDGNLRENDSDTQLLDVFNESQHSNKVVEVTINIPTQSTFCESVQSHSLLKEFELIQSSQTFCQTETVKDKQDCTEANIVTVRENKIENNNLNSVRNPSVSSKSHANIVTNKENAFKNDNINTIRNPTGLGQSTLTCEDSQKTILYSLNGCFEEFTHVSESQSDFWKIKNNYLFNTASKKSTDLCVAKEKESFINTKIYDNAVYTQDINKYVNFNKASSEIVFSETKKDKYNAKENKINVDQSSHQEINPNFGLYTSQTNTFDILNKTKTDNIIETIHKNINKDNAEIYCTDTSQSLDNINNKNNSKAPNTLDETMNYEMESNNPNQYQIDIEDGDRIIPEDSQAELISFKVIEELNRVKSYLNRRDNRVATEGYATDSGYRSDSQSRSSTKSFHSSNVWINQSGHCLLRFIMDCPIVLKTREISIEISRTLGRLIDKLHEEENYPSFLEEVLDTVETLLRDIFEGDSYVEDVILKKDFYIHKLFYLNRSYHIMQYTLDKITQILESFLSRITEDSTLEITDTIQMENLSYIFSILEHLLKKHAATKDILSQNVTQATLDDDKSLKRSSLTDVWRKKWNPNYKSESQQSNPKKKCSEMKCSEVLNKIIVKAMDGYSLISFSALQCYNLLQS